MHVLKTHRIGKNFHSSTFFVYEETGTFCTFLFFISYAGCVYQKYKIFNNYEECPAIYSIRQVLLFYCRGGVVNVITKTLVHEVTMIDVVVNPLDRLVTASSLTNSSECKEASYDAEPDVVSSVRKCWNRSIPA